MSCTHKFYGHHAHLSGINGLLPNWEIQTLIVGTFNPEQLWHTKNKADYYYGRTRNYFWKILPKFTGKQSISHSNVTEQIRFLEYNKIGVTDLLVRIDDADINNPEHRARIETVLDDKIELFKEFTWNTNSIIQFIKTNQVEAVYFTKLGNPSAVNPRLNTFESQIRIIEKECKYLGIYTNRLHTPSGQGLGKGKPRSNNLIRRWYNQNGGNRFPFLKKDFNLDNFQVQN